MSHGQRNRVYNSNSGAARRFGVHEKRVREWQNFKAEIEERGPKKK